MSAVIETIYFAGPDVFRRDVATWRDETIALCRAAGVTPLLPCDGEETAPVAIRASNLEMIRRADAVIANVNPFRGAEPDSGTAFEIGYACAKGKRVVCFVGSAETLEERVARLCGPLAVVRDEPFRLRDRDGFGVEAFGLGANLMIAAGSRIVVGGPLEALEALLGMRLRDVSAAPAGRRHAA